LEALVLGMGWFIIWGNGRVGGQNGAKNEREHEGRPRIVRAARKSEQSRRENF